MKGTNRKFSRADEPPIPVTLPLVIAAVQDSGSIQVTVDGVLLVEGPIDRDDLGRVLSAIADDAGTPIRAEIREADERVFADIITPPARRSRFAPPPDAPAPGPGPLPVEVSGEGFVPGEDVAVLLVASHTSASGTGRARAVLEQAKVPGGASDVVLFGEISGTIVRQGAAR